MRLSPIAMTDTRVTRETINGSLLSQMLNMGFSSVADVTSSVRASHHITPPTVDLVLFFPPRAHKHGAPTIDVHVTSFKILSALLLHLPCMSYRFLSCSILFHCLLKHVRHVEDIDENVNMRSTLCECGASREAQARALKRALCLGGHALVFKDAIWTSLWSHNSNF